MKCATFLIFLGFCVLLASANSLSDSQSDHSDSESVQTDDSEQFGYESNEEGSEDWGNFTDEDDITGGKNNDDNNNDNDNDALNPEQEGILEKIRKKLEGKKKKKTVHTSMQATDRLMKELRNTYQSQAFKSGQYDIELVNESVYEWKVFLRNIDVDSPLYEDLTKLNETLGQDCIIINIKFKSNYPFEAPFVRVVSPILEGGYVSSGGAICMELLTVQGWNPAYSVEAIIMQVVNVLVIGQTRIPEQKKGEAETIYNAEDARITFQKLEYRHDLYGFGQQPDHD